MSKSSPQMVSEKFSFKWMTVRNDLKWVYNVKLMYLSILMKKIIIKYVLILGGRLADQFCKILHRLIKKVAGLMKPES